MEHYSFSQLGLSDKTIAIINEKGFEEPTEIQRKTIPLILSGEKDVIGQAQTGTGKTAAFGLPILERISENAGVVQALILVPTRELAIQVSEELNSLKGKKKFSIMPIYGGQSMGEQIRRLNRGIDIVVGTPGRIMDHLRRKTLVLGSLSFAVLDEADEMLNMGFVEDIEEIFGQMNTDRHTLLFSATMPKHIQNIAREYMKEHVLVKVEKDKMTVEQTDQIYFEVSPSDKFEALCRIVDIEEEFYGLIFCRTRVAVDELALKLLDRGYDAEGLHGDFSQNQREMTLKKFKTKRVNMLVATDVAARGIDISDLTHVINYSLPQDTDSYIHRIGRTGRAGKKGIAITFISPPEYRRLSAIMKVTKSDIRKEKIPEVSDIINAKKGRIEVEISKILKKGPGPDYLTTAMSLTENNEPLEVIAALLELGFSDELDQGSYSSIKKVQSISVDEKGTTRLFVAMGIKDGMDPKKLVSFITNKSKVKAGRISGVTVKQSFSFLTVPFEDAEVIIKAFKKQGRNKGPLINVASVEKKGKKVNKYSGQKKTYKKTDKKSVKKNVRKKD